MPRLVVPMAEPPRAAFLQAVEQHVIGHDDVGPLGKPQVFQADARLSQLVHLTQDAVGVDHGARAYNTFGCRVKDPRWHEMQSKRAELVDHRVAGIVATLKTNDHIGVLGEKVDDTPLTLVAPLGAHDRANRHSNPPTGTRRLRQPHGPFNAAGGTGNSQTTDLAVSYVKYIQRLLRHE